jgi:hypothetical protein
MNEFTQKLIEQAKDNPYFHLDGYMERYWLAPFKENGGNVRIHHILSSDADRHLHDHPWASTSVILDGGYWEVMPADPLQHPSKDADAFIKVWRAPGRCCYKTSQLTTSDSSPGRQNFVEYVHHGSV